MSELAGKTGPRSRPQYRNIHVSQILKYRLPLPGVVSILHRVSGALLFLLGIPFMLYLLQQSISSELSYERYHEFVTDGFVRLVMLAVAWAFLHHLCAGIRFLLLDVHLGVDKLPAKQSATIVLAASLLLTVVVGLKIFGAF
jgi:succinate dehydrogenase / fumarate reductase cytochrome b subunit